MKKLQSTLPNMLMSLGGVALLSGLLLGGMYSLTKQPIAEATARQQQTAIAEVAPPFTNDPVADARTLEVEGTQVTVYPAMADGRLQGAAVKASTMTGFGGEVELMCGFDADGSVRDYRVLRQAETPGLGTRMATWFRDPAGKRSVIGRNPGVTPFYVTKDAGGEVDGITAATISSRAFLSVMREAYGAYREYAAADGITLPAACQPGAGGDARSGASTRR